MANRYWVGGAGNWDATTTTNWAATSNGTGGQSVPTSADDVFFDGSSGTGNVNITGSPSIKSLTCTGISAALIFSGTTTAASMTIAGDLTFGTGQTFSATLAPTITLTGTGAQKITSNGTTYQNNMTVNSTGGTYTQQDAFAVASPFTLTSGTWDANTFNFTSSRVAITGSVARTLKMGGGLWTLSGTGVVWNITGTNFTFDKSSSNIQLTNTTTTARTFVGFGLIYNKITIGGATGISTTTFSSSFRIGELASTKTVAHTITFTAGTVVLIDKFSIAGTLGNVVTIGSSALSQVTLQKPSPWYIGSNSTDGGNNTNVSLISATQTENAFTPNYISMSYVNGTYVGGSMIPFFA